MESVDKEKEDIRCVLSSALNAPTRGREGSDLTEQVNLDMSAINANNPSFIQEENEDTQQTPTSNSSHPSQTSPVTPASSSRSRGRQIPMMDESGITEGYPDWGDRTRIKVETGSVAKYEYLALNTRYEYESNKVEGIKEREDRDNRTPGIKTRVGPECPPCGVYTDMSCIPVQKELIGTRTPNGDVNEGKKLEFYKWNLLTTEYASNQAYFRDLHLMARASPGIKRVEDILVAATKRDFGTDKEAGALRYDIDRQYAFHKSFTPLYRKIITLAPLGQQEALYTDYLRSHYGYFIRSKVQEELRWQDRIRYNVGQSRTWQGMVAWGALLISLFSLGQVIVSVVELTRT